MVIVLPKAKGNSIFVSLNFLEFKMLSIDTICGFLLGTSIPIVPFPGMGAMMRIPSAERLRAISSSKLRILEIRTPSAGVISYSVIVGPTVAFISRMDTPKLLSTSTIRALLALISSMSTVGLSTLSYFFNRSRVGFLYLVNGSRGLIGVLSILSISRTPSALSSPFGTSMVSFPSSEVILSSISSFFCSCIGDDSSSFLRERMGVVADSKLVKSTIGAGKSSGSPSSIWSVISSSTILFSVSVCDDSISFSTSSSLFK